MEPVKVGGETSAYCTSCRQMRHHIVVAMVGAVPARVECLSCHKQHNYKAAPPGTPKSKTKAADGASPAKRVVARAKAGGAAAASEHPLDALLAVRSASEARVYRPGDRYAVGELVQHPSFGLGAVSALPAPGKVEIIFRDQSRLLMHERPAEGPAAPKLQPPPRREDRPALSGASDAPPKR